MCTLSPGCLVEAKFDYDATEDAELSFRKGDRFVYLESDPRGWGKGVINGKRGWFAISFVQVVPEDELCDPEESHDSNDCLPQHHQSWSHDAPQSHSLSPPHTRKTSDGPPIVPRRTTAAPANRSSPSSPNNAKVASQLPRPGVRKGRPPAPQHYGTVPAKPVASNAPPTRRIAATQSINPTPKSFETTSRPSEGQMVLPVIPPKVNKPNTARHKRQRSDATSATAFVPEVMTRPQALTIAFSQNSPSPPVPPRGIVRPNPAATATMLRAFGAPEPAIKSHSESDDNRKGRWNDADTAPTDEGQTFSILESRKRTEELLQMWLPTRAQLKPDVAQESAITAMIVQQKSKKKSKMVPQFKRVKTKGVFGIPLEELQMQGREIPIIIMQCISFLQNAGLGMEGIFRVPGNRDMVEKLKRAYKSPSDWVDKKEFKNAHVVATMLKQFFQQLPEPLFPYDFYDAFMKSYDTTQTDTEKVELYRGLLQRMPRTNSSVARFLIKFLSLVAENSDKNKMEAFNLGIVFGPTLLKPEVQDMAQMMENESAKVIEFLIDHYQDVFKEVEPEQGRSRDF